MSAQGITITRVFEASRERVWQEWTQPEPFADWFGGRDSEVPLSTVSMDVRPGGRWRLTMFADPGRREIRWKGEYREVVEPRTARVHRLGPGGGGSLRADHRRPHRARRRPHG